MTLINTQSVKIESGGSGSDPLQGTLSLRSEWVKKNYSLLLTSNVTTSTSMGIPEIDATTTTYIGNRSSDDIQINMSPMTRSTTTYGTGYNKKTTSGTAYITLSNSEMLDMLNTLSWSGTGSGIIEIPARIYPRFTYSNEPLPSNVTSNFTIYLSITIENGTITNVRRIVDVPVNYGYYDAMNAITATDSMTFNVGTTTRFLTEQTLNITIDLYYYVTLYMPSNTSIQTTAAKVRIFNKP